VRTSPPRAAGYQLAIGSPDTAAVSVVLAPHESLLALLRQAAGPAPATGLARAIWQQLQPSARAAISPLASGALLPDCISPIPPDFDIPIAEEADRLRELPADVLSEELHGLFDGRLPAAWQGPGQRPRQWLHALADALLDAWAVMEPSWLGAQSLFDREARRVGTAAVRGGLDALLNTLHPRIHYADQTLTYRTPHTRRVDLGPRRLALLPMLAGPTASFACFDQPHVACVAYPLAGPGRRPMGDQLSVLLGAPRATTLRALDHPLTINQIAALVRCAPSTATYQCQQLETAGLVSRQRRGPFVLVSRTARGERLIDVMTDV
jgi:hypothetical protein